MSTQNLVIEQPWFARASTEVGPELIGCSLIRQFPDGRIQRGIIVEVEAYGPNDPACHGYRKRTPRNAAMFGPAGHSYVYLIYGMYHCLNIVTDQEDIPSAVLLRALDLNGANSTLEKKAQRLAAGPGKLCRHLDIDRSLNQMVLKPGQPLWVEHRSQKWEKALTEQSHSIVQTTRIGLSQGIDSPWRWYLKDNIAISKI
jgi:DNA-3-methyladenine glycosylase